LSVPCSLFPVPFFVKIVSIFILLSQTWDRIRQHHEDKETWPVSEDDLGFLQKHTKFVWDETRGLFGICGGGGGGSASSGR
jgi:hypothetical protein